jgi:hypothetical protein
MRGDDRGNGLAHASLRSVRAAIGRRGAGADGILEVEGGVSIVDRIPELWEFPSFRSNWCAIVYIGLVALLFQ